jgi:DNA-directed RNA polymerase specialized sigma24 family protein
MASRDTELTAFVDARGLALMRTASLLAPGDAEDVLAEALARTARRWREATADDDVERHARHELYTAVVSRWRKDGGLDVDDATGADDTEPSARQHLRTLTRRERAVLVLRGYEGLDSDEVASLLRMKPAEVDQLRDRTARRVTDAAAVSSVGELLREAARTDVPRDLAPQALGASRSSGRRAVWIAAALVVALGVTAALMVRTEPAPEASAPDPAIARWGLPSALPLPADLPDLGEQPVDVASAAYLVQGVPVVVDSSSGLASTVFRDAPSPEWFDGNSAERDSPLLGRAGRWTDLALSPDGTRLLLVQAPRPYFDGERSRRVYLFALDRASLDALRDLSPTNREERFSRVKGAALAWAPDSGAFACACDGSLTVVTLADDGTVDVLPTSWPATDVAWGGVGVAAQAANGEWALIDSGGELRLDTISFSDVLAMSATRPPQYLTATTGTIYSLAGDAKPDGARCVLWDADIADPVPVIPMPDRDGVLCTPVVIQPGRSAFVIVIRSSLPRPQPSALDVVVVDTDGAAEPVSLLPPGTAAASFAGDLVG